MRSIACRVACSATLVLIGTHAFGQDGGPPLQPRFTMDVLVTPERGETSLDHVAAASTTIDASDVNALPVGDLGELLARLPGINTSRFTFAIGAPVVSARGFFGGGEAEYVMLLVDGIRVANSDTGLIDWSALPLSTIRRVELLRGPGASLYGDASLGGVIQVFTDRPQATGRLSSTVGSFGTVTLDGAISRRRETTLTMSGSVRRTGGAVTHSAAHQIDAAAAAERTTGPLTWRWTGSGYLLDRENPGAVRRVTLAERRDVSYTSDGVDPVDNLDRQNGSTSLSLRHSTWATQPSLRISLTRRTDRELRTILLVPGIGDRQDRNVGAWSSAAAFDGEQQVRFLGGVLLRFGVEGGSDQVTVSYRSVDDSRQPTGPSNAIDADRLRIGTFASAAWEPHARVRITGAVRHDVIADDETATAERGRQHEAWSPRVGTTVRLRDAGSVVVFGQISRAFKAPTLDQLFDPRRLPDFRGGGFTISNAQLSPQRALNLEVGARGGHSLRWGAVAYWMPVEDEIDFDARTFSYANIGRSLHRGVELDLGASTPVVRPSLWYAWSRVTPRDDSQQLKNVPEHTISAGATVTLPKAVTLSAHLRHSWNAHLDDAHQFELHTARSLDLRLRHDVRRISVFLDVFNLFDDRAEEFGFILTGFRGDQAPYVYRGTPRAARLGATFSF